ncbi:MAG: hypothetical protein QM768_10360 [Agriterribacter sp.]
MKRKKICSADAENICKGKSKTNACVSIEQYNKELEEAKRQIESGNFITQEELEKEIKQW